MTFREDSESDDESVYEHDEEGGDWCRWGVSVLLTAVIEAGFIVLAVKLNLLFFLALPLVPVIMFWGYKHDSYRQLKHQQDAKAATSSKGVLNAGGKKRWESNAKVCPTDAKGLIAKRFEKKSSNDFVVDIDPGNKKMWDAFSHIVGLPTRFSYEELVKATNKFQRRVGTGGLATVYEGQHPHTGQRIAVKEFHQQDDFQRVDNEFRAELASGSANISYMVQLLGFCLEDAHKFLVYEFMANGSLDKWIFQEPVTGNFAPRTGAILDWDKRYKIAVGVAQNLANWHEMCEDQFIYFDIKPQNVLLDHGFQSRLTLSNFTKAPERKDIAIPIDLSDIIFTKGYVAPEVLLRESITSKSDVFSFGMVLLELVSGRQNRDDMQADPQRRYYPAWAQHCILNPVLTDSSEAGAHSFELDDDNCRVELEKLVDYRLGARFQKDQSLRLLKVALWCIQKDPSFRPPMKEVVQLLEGQMQVTLPQANSEFADIVTDSSLLPPDKTSFSPEPCRFTGPNPTRSDSFIFTAPTHLPLRHDSFRFLPSFPLAAPVLDRSLPPPPTQIRTSIPHSSPMEPDSSR